MKTSGIISLIVAAGLLAAAAFAKDKDQGKMDLANPAEFGSAELQPGSYKVEWTGSGPNVQVSILQHDRTVATTQAKVIELEQPYAADAVVLRTEKNGQPAAIEQIDFHNRTEALEIEPSMSGQSNTMQRR